MSKEVWNDISLLCVGSTFATASSLEAVCTTSNWESSAGAGSPSCGTIHEDLFNYSGNDCKDGEKGFAIILPFIMFHSHPVHYTCMYVCPHAIFLPLQSLLRKK